MQIEDLEKLPEEIGVYKKNSASTYINTKKNGFGVTINVKTNEIVFGMWIPAGAILFREKIESIDDAIKIITEAQDILEYRKKRMKKAQKIFNFLHK